VSSSLYSVKQRSCCYIKSRMISCYAEGMKCGSADAASRCAPAEKPFDDRGDIFRKKHIPVPYNRDLMCGIDV